MKDLLPFSATESRKRKRGLDVNDLKRIFDTEPDDYEIAWNELKHHIIGLSEHARQTVLSVKLHYLYCW